MYILGKDKVKSDRYIPCSFIISKLLSSYSVPGTVLGPRDTALNRPGRNLCPHLMEIPSMRG